MDLETLVITKKEEKKEVITDSPSKPAPKKQETINIFALQQEMQKKEESVIIETPNYDTIEELPPEKREKIFKVEKEFSPAAENKKSKKFRLAIFGVLICLFGAFFISNTVNIIKASQALQETQTAYSASLQELMQKIHSTESGNRALDLFETYPENELPASSVGESSNWFDRFCNFLSGLFGG